MENLCFYWKKKHLNFRDNDYDILLFNQQWPKTTCLQNGKKSSQCNIRNDAWSIHGIWATKNFPGKHPENCNYYQPFNVKNLWTIKRELVDKWYNILPVKVENFWKWEWKKHGTCFSDLPELNTQLKYFHQGLQWSKNYVIGNILSSSGIIMGKSYSYDAIQTALKDGLNVAPQIYCYKDKVSNFVLFCFLFNRIILFFV